MNNKKPPRIVAFLPSFKEDAMASERLKRREVKSVNMWD
jgi:hypothetical protein